MKAERDEKGRFAQGNNIGAKHRFQTGGQAAEKGSKGGINSQEQKKRRKIWREELDEILLAEVTSTSGKTATKNRVILEQQVNKALKGDTKAATFIGKITGDITTQVEVNMNNDEPLVLAKVYEGDE